MSDFRASLVFSTCTASVTVSHGQSRDEPVFVVIINSKQ